MRRAVYLLRSRRRTVLFCSKLVGAGVAKIKTLLFKDKKNSDLYLLSHIKNSE